MSSYRASHPDAGRLLQYADGELSNRDAAEIRTHLEACWNCRAEIEDIEETVTEYACYQRRLFEAPPEPPVSWERFEIRLDRVIAERHKPPRVPILAIAAAFAAVAAACLVAV